MQRGWAPVLGDVTSRFSLLFVEDLADAVRQLLEIPECPPGPFEIHDGRPRGYDWEELIHTVARIVRKRIRRLRVPVGVLRSAGYANLFGARLFRYRPMLTPGKVRELTHADWVCDDAPLRAASGWRPEVLLAEGMQRTLAHLQAGR
jgi:nucleoside-diphosphate-sugar epimerase